MKDSKMFLGASAGFAGAIVMVVLIYLLDFFGIEVRIIPAISQIFMSKSLVGTTQGQLMGIIAHLICGAIIGLGFLSGLEVTGYNNTILKGALFGVGVWFLLCGILATLLNISMQGSFSAGFFSLLLHIIYGIITAWIIVKFSGFRHHAH